MSNINQVSPDNLLLDELQESQNSQSTSGSNNKRRGIKFGTPEVIEIGELKHLFDIVGAKYRMDKLKAAKLCRDQYLEQMIQEGGDIHYFKCQTFGASYKRQVIINTTRI